MTTTETQAVNATVAEAETPAVRFDQLHPVLQRAIQLGRWYPGCEEGRYPTAAEFEGHFDVSAAGYPFHKPR